MGVVIPCYNEYDYIFALLDSLRKNKYFVQTLVVLVINNPPQDKRGNLRTLKKLKSGYILDNLKILDYTKGLGEKQGVGKARVLGFNYLAKFLGETAPYIWLDADCLVRKDYLKEIYSFYQDKNNNAGWCTFKHSRSNDQRINKAIKLYEDFLYSHYLSLKEAGSFYAYVAIGSTITCRRFVYEKSGGCDEKRTAGEDFYFLQSLTKLGFFRFFA